MSGSGADSTGLVSVRRALGRCAQILVVEDERVVAMDLRAVLQEALDAFLRTLDGYTLADLVARRRRSLARLLAS